MKATPLRLVPATKAARAGGRARAPYRRALEPARLPQARRAPRAHRWRKRGGALEGRARRGGRRRGRCFRRCRGGPFSGARRRTAGRIGAGACARLAGERSCRRRACHRRSRDRCRGGTLRRRGPPSRRPLQHHRQAELLRRAVRRHRQPLPAPRRDLDGWGGAGLRPGDPRQDRGAPAARPQEIGRRRRAIGGPTSRASTSASPAGAASGNASRARRWRSRR